jgi:hypothetical protein
MKAAPKVKFLPVMLGPAAKLWTANGFHASALLSLDDALASAACVLSGTGWASDIEHEARRRANELGLRNVAVIDHWVNYPARFERHGTVALPDEIWVTDKYAFDIASTCFIRQKISQRPNLYLQAQVEQIAHLSTSTAGQLLYVLEPLRFSWPGCRQPAEFEALDFFVGNLSKITTQESLQIRLRPHPSDAEGKYTDWLSANAKHGITLDTCTSLSEAIGRVEWVAGCETAAMVVALAAGRKVLPAAPKCRLPHDGMVHLCDLM